MRNFIDEMEAAYRSSRRQGNLMRDPQQERSAHQDRRNRYHDNDLPGAETYGRRTEPMRQTMDYDQRPLGGSYPNHSGKGPKNYKRSDERIKDLVCQKLADDPELDASNVEVEVNNSEVTLTGNVNGKFEKYLVEDLVESVSGVSHVDNRIRVSKR